VYQSVHSCHDKPLLSIIYHSPIFLRQISSIFNVYILCINKPRHCWSIKYRCCLVWIKQVEGEISYNGYKLNEFVPRKTSAYISQNDVHLGVMTVKETLDFSARCQGVGTRYGIN
jgi:hypothetical protein